MQQTDFSIQVIDSHTGGEPTRVIYAGFPNLKGNSLVEQRDNFQQQFDYLRQALILEPRGSEVLVGALLRPPIHPTATAGVIFFNNAGYLGMCGHGMIGVINTLHYLGHIQPGIHHIETPVGIVKCTLHDNYEVSIQNVPAYRFQKEVSVIVEGIGQVIGDIAWGGNWFFLIHQHRFNITAQNIPALTEFAWQVRQALDKQHITGKDNGLIDHIELFASSDTADSRSFVLCPGKAYDRSPCGTGTSAKLACLAAENMLAPNTVWIQESVIGSQFKAFYHYASDHPTMIIPTIIGRAHIYADTRLLLAQNDPFQYGIITS